MEDEAMIPDLEPWRVVLVPISALKPHEGVEESKVAEVASQIASRGAVSSPVLVDAKTLVILDGHHRVEALKRLDCVLAPALLADYDSDCVKVSSWRENIVVRKEDVRKAGLEGALMPPKTSRHILCLQPPVINIPLDALRDSTRAYELVLDLRSEVEPRRSKL